jgi:hypothetical protein
MDALRNVVTPRTARNVLICSGAYYLCGWLAFLFAICYDKLADRMVYIGNFQTIVVLPLVEHFPRALFAVAVGIAVVYCVESDHLMKWALFPTLMYAGVGFLGYHWSRPPVLTDRIEQAIGAFFPAVTCILGAALAKRHRSKAGSRRGLLVQLT